jgi:starvation-inducible DNA-binding protein
MKKSKTTTSKKSDLASKLNELLSAYQVVYFNTRASHWMIKGENFFELHKVFETAYNDATVKIDEIAERILTLGGRPYLTATEMIGASVVKEYQVSGDEVRCVQGLLDDLTQLADLEKEAVKIAAGEEDIVTADLLTGYLGEQQKTSWMLSQFLSKKSSIK